MKTQIKRLSKSTLAVVLSVCLLISCMTVGIIATDAAYDNSESVGSYNNYYIEYNSAGSGTANFNSSGVAEIVATQTGTMYLGFKRNDWGGDGYFGHDSYTISPGSTVWEVYQYNTNWIALSVTSGKKYTFQLTQEGGTTKFTVTQSNNTTKLATPSLKYNNVTTTPVDVTGTPANLTWAAVSNASSYTIYKDGNAVQTGNTSRSYTPSSTGSYTVKAIGNGTTYSDSDASNAIQLNFQKTTTIYVKKTLTSTFSNIHIWSNTNDNWTGTWPGVAISSSWTEYGDYYYYSFTNAYSTFKFILNNNSSPQTNDSDAYDTGKSYYIDTATANTKAALTEGTPVPKYDVTFTPSPTGGTVKVNNSSTSPQKVQENTNYTVLAKPNAGYTLSAITIGGTAKSAAEITAAGNDTDGYSFTQSVGTANKTVTATFSAKTYTVTLNKNSGTGGTNSVTATYNAAMPTTSVTMPTRDGYTFQGYYDTSATTGGTQYYTSAGASAHVWDKTAATTLYARWSEITGGAVAKAYTSGSASSTGGTVKVGSGSGSGSASVNLSGIGITSSNTVTATKKTNYSFTGWQFSGINCTKLRYRFGTSDEWLTPAANTTYGTSSQTTIYIKTDGSSGITTSNAEVRALFVETDYTGLLVGAQYTENGSSYVDFSTTPSGVTIAVNHGTNQTGVAVSAPGTDPTGYVFAGWYTASGSFTNAADKDTTFKPNATGAKAIARYKKIYTITSSVDPTGTGAGAAPTINITSGTVSGQTNKILAGGSYTIAASATGSYNAIESITVNNTNKGSNSSYSISTVSGDQNIVVKYKSTVYLRGGSTIGTNWSTGDIMQSNDAGNSFTKTYSDVAGSSSGTTYYFKLHNGDYVNPDGTATVTITGGNSTATYSYQTTGDKNNVLTLKKNCNITIVSNGSKITSITVRPTSIVQKAITFKQVVGSTITGTYDSTPFTTASGDVTVQVYQNDDISFTVTADTGKYISALSSTSGTPSPAFAAADSYTGTISNVTAASTITPTVASKFSITAKTNKSSRGTVSVDKTSARPGETVTVKYTPSSGIISSITVAKASTPNSPFKTFSFNNGVLQASSNNFTKLEVTEISEKIYDLFNKSGDEIGATDTDEPVGAEITAGTFTVPNDMAAGDSIIVNATFDAYSAESNWYYNGYTTSGAQQTGYYSKQMTEGIVSGEKFSYYHVEGRTGDDQLFTVSDGKVAETRYVYFTRPNAFGYWNQSNSPKAHFWKNGGSDYDTWPGNTMTWVYNNDMGQGVFKIAIPVGADRVSFNDGSNSGTQQTVDIDLTNTSGAYYVSQWNDSAQKYDYGTWDAGYDDQGWIASGTEYFYDSEKYTSDFSTKGYYNHNVSGTDYTKPKDLGTSKGDYYINVLYPGKTYTINGVTKTIGSKPMIIWTTEPLANDGDTVKVYAKDGSIRSESYGSTYANIADTKIYSADGTTTVGTKLSGGITNQTYETYNAGLGDTIVIKTQIGATDSGTLSNASTLKSTYYVRGFCVNGEVSQLLEWNADGLYTLTYKIPEDYEGKNIEITPIYYLQNNSNIVTYRVTGFTDELKQVGSGKPNWGDTLYTYPFYGKLGSNNNALGAYPGQPMVYYKGQYQMQIPEKSTAWDIYYDDSALSGYSGNTAKENAVHNTNVSGVTMSNGYYDIVHRQIMGYGDNSSSADHVQTYDYGDFYKIFNEKAPVDNIVFDFKYETTMHNFESNPVASYTKTQLDTNYGTNGNGFELLTNFHGRTVDLFGTPLSGDAADPSKTTPVYVISIGGVNGSAGVENIAGYYATEWMVYGSSNGTNYSRITAGSKNSIPPEVLVLNDDDNTSFNTSTYPSAVDGKAVTDWKALYTALEEYRGKPVMISYEAADAQIGSGNYATSGGGGATRNDGRWLYSKNGETITSKIRVDVSEDNGATYSENPAAGETGHVSDLDAYFTNAEVDGETTYTTTIDPDKTFDFEAHSNNENYKFMGWYMADGTKITTDNIGHTERSGSYTFVARFMHFTGGQLILGHKASTDSTYTGAGTATIAVTVKDGNNEIVREIAATSSDITLDDKIINNENTAYTIEVTLNAAGTGEDTYARTTCSAANTFFGGQSAYTTMPQTFSFTVGSLFSDSTQNVKKITYNSFFNQVQYTYKYTFSFPARDGSEKTYVREGTLSAAQREAYVTGTGDESRVLTEAFVNSLAPHESNFNQTLKWDITAADRTFTKSENNYSLTKTLTAVNITAQYDEGDYIPDAGETVRTTKRSVTFSLPYEHTNGVPSDLLIMDKATATNFAVTGIPYGQLVKSNNNLITAPRQLKETVDGEEVIKNFQYWDVKSTKTNNTVAKCYYYSFNFIVYDNYTITPIYAEGDSPMAASGTSTNITYLESSRNQYNGSGETSTGTGTAADLIYNDFVLSFNYDDVDIYKNDSTSDAVSKIGILVERVQALETQQDGTPYTDPNHYSEKALATTDQIKDFISTGTTGDATLNKALSKKDIAKNSLDNKNRMEYYKGYYNTAGWDKDTQKPGTKYAYKNYVYKAYTYMIVNGEVILSDPVYFTMYDEAAK